MEELRELLTASKREATRLQGQLLELEQARRDTRQVERLELQVAELTQRISSMTELESRARDDDSLKQNPGPASQLEWTLQAWLLSLDLTQPVLVALTDALGATETAATHLELLRSDKCTRDLIQSSLTMHGLSGLTDMIWAAVEQLRKALTVEDTQQGKFVQEAAGLLEYADLSTFFGGLEGVVGAPSPKVQEAMESEHTSRSDSTVEFTSNNYSVTTTSEIEWAFVAEPDSRPEGGWPKERRLLAAEFARFAGKGGGRAAGASVLDAGATRRKPMPIAELQWIVADLGRKLAALEEPSITLEEALAARMYTGPCFVKYNAVLRGLKSTVPYLRNDMVQRCCSKSTYEAYMGDARMWEIPAGSLSFSDARKGLNTYTTTIHAINSSIIKLSKLTVATQVFRGVSKMALPERFWSANQFGVKGGIEGGFMSSTADKAVAMSYASSGVGFVFELQQGMIDRGANLTPLSQYPHEKEILFAPLTGIEVQSMRTEGSITIVSCSVSVNLSSLTIEQVIGKRKKMLRDMLPGLLADLRQKTTEEGFATIEGTEWLAERLLMRCKIRILRQQDAWYNIDENLQTALGELLATCRGMSPGGAARAEELAALGPSTCERYGFRSEAFTDTIVKTLQIMEKEDETKAADAVETLAKLQPELLSQHAKALIALLAHEEYEVRDAAVVALGKLPAASLAQHADAFIHNLNDDDFDVRNAAVEMLGKLEALALASHMEEFVEMLTHSEWGVRLSAVAVLGFVETEVLSQHKESIESWEASEKDQRVLMAATRVFCILRPQSAEQHVSSVISFLEDPNFELRRVAVATFGHLGDASMNRYAQSVMVKRKHSDPEVRKAVLQAMKKLQAKSLEVYAPTLSSSLKDSDMGVRRCAVSVFAKLDATVMEKYAKVIIAQLKFEDPRWEAVSALKRLTPGALAKHAQLIASRVKSKDTDVCEAAIDVLLKLEPVALAKHANVLVAKLHDPELAIRWVSVEALGKLEPSDIATHASAIAEKFIDPDEDVRRVALETMGKSQPDSLAHYAAEVAAKLQDSHHKVRKAAVEVLGKLKLAVLVQQAAALVAKLTDAESSVRKAAVDVLGQLEPAMLEPHASAFFKLVKDSDADVRESAQKVLGYLSSAGCLSGLSEWEVAEELFRGKSL